MDKFGPYIQKLMTTVLDKEQDDFVKELAHNELTRLKVDVEEFLMKYQKNDNEEVEKFYGKDFIKHLFANTGDVIFSKGDILHKSTKSINKEKTVLIINFEAKVDSDRSYPPDKIKLNRLDWNNIPIERKRLASNMEII